MNSKWIGITVLVLLAGLVGWGVYWFLSNYERQYREVRVGVSPEARRNPFLAAERFLRQLGLDAESVAGREYLLRPPAETGVLLVNRLSPDLSPDHEEALLAWMEGGGHLIVTAHREWDEDGERAGNPLLERYGVRLRIQLPSEEPEASQEGEDGKDSEDSKDECEPCDPLTVAFPGHRDGVRVAFQNGRWLEETTDLADWAVEREDGAHLLQFRIGQGRLTVLSDHQYLVNDHIGEQDHALFLALLTEGERRVWLLYSSRMPSLFTLLWRAAPYLMLSVLVLAGLWLWSQTLRTGPLLRRETRVRRNLLEHLDAAANYAWQTDRAGGMFQTSQKVLEQGWRRRHPGLDRLEQTQRCEKIAELAGIAGPAVEAALYGRVEKEQAFIRASAVQQELLTGISLVRSADATAPSHIPQQTEREK